MVTLAIGAWGGAGLIALESSLAVPVLIVGVVAAFLSLFVLRRAVEGDPQIREEDRSKILGWLTWFGPAGAVQLLLFIHFPGSKFGGH